MKKATRGRFDGKFQFLDVPDEDLYFRDLNRAMVDIAFSPSGLERPCFVHRGHYSPNYPKELWWTVSDCQTGLGVAAGPTAQHAIDEARRRSIQRELDEIAQSVMNFLTDYGYPNCEKPDPTLNAVVFWRQRLRDGYHPLVWGIIQKGVASITVREATAVIVNGPRIVEKSEILYVWPRREDFTCPHR
jgi:hypothetical protein